MAEELHKRIAIIGSADPARTQPTPSTPHTSDLGDLTALQFQTYDLFSVAIGFLAGLALDATYQRPRQVGGGGNRAPRLQSRPVISTALLVRPPSLATISTLPRGTATV